MTANNTSLNDLKNNTIYEKFKNEKKYKNY